MRLLRITLFRTTIKPIVFPPSCGPSRRRARLVPYHSAQPSFVLNTIRIWLLLPSFDQLASAFPYRSCERFVVSEDLVTGRKL